MKGEDTSFFLWFSGPDEEICKMKKCLYLLIVLFAGFIQCTPAKEKVVFNHKNEIFHKEISTSEDGPGPIECFIYKQFSIFTMLPSLRTYQVGEFLRAFGRRLPGSSVASQRRDPCGRGR